MTSGVPLQLLGIAKSFVQVQALQPMTQTIAGGERFKQYHDTAQQAIGGQQ